MSGHHSSNATTLEGTCKVSMLWNWDTIDTCVLAESWHVTNRAMFAASCIGVAVLAIGYEAMRRVCREYDTFVSRQLGDLTVLDGESSVGPWFITSYNHGPRRATPFQQLVRTVLHVLAVGVGYLLMLVLMAFNGYLFISILIGVGIGKFFCDWLSIECDTGYSHHSSAQSQPSEENYKDTPTP